MMVFATAGETLTKAAFSGAWLFAFVLILFFALAKGFFSTAFLGLVLAADLGLAAAVFGTAKRALALALLACGNDFCSVWKRSHYPGIEGDRLVSKSVGTGYGKG